MHVLNVVTDDDRRGGQIFASDLSAALTDIGVGSRLVALAPGQVGGLDIDSLGPTRFSGRTLAALRREMSRADVTVAHGSSTLPACSAASVGRGRPWVARQISETAFWSNSWSRRARVRTYLRSAARVVALAPSAAADLRSVLSIPASKISIVPNGVPAAGFSPSDAAARAAARRAFGLDPDDPTVVSLAALVPEKGVDVVVSAVAALPAVQLLVGGAGPEQASLEALARRLAPGRVVFTGSLAHPARALAAADIVALASRGGDSMPATLIEAGFCAIPSVATAVGAIPETIMDGETGLVVDDAEVTAFELALGRLVEDTGLRRRLGVQARIRCLEHFEIGVVAEQWQAVLEQVSSGAR